MKKFNVIQFVATAAVDLNGEFEDLENLVEEGAEKVKEIQRQYNHLDSLIQGMEYTVEFISDDETCEEVGEFLKDQRKYLMNLLPACLQVVWSEKLGEKVEIMTTYRADQSKYHILSVGGRPEGTFEKIEDLSKHLKTLEK